MSNPLPWKMIARYADGEEVIAGGSDAGQAAPGSCSRWNSSMARQFPYRASLMTAMTEADILEKRHRKNSRRSANS